jgi:uracil phosphoribosyltransferase
VYSDPVPTTIVHHPVAAEALVTLRDSRTPPDAFRRAATRISLVLITEAVRDLPTRPVTVQTPLGPAPGEALTRGLVFVPVLRAGLGMLSAALELVPSAHVGHLGLRRDEETAIASQYYARFPEHLETSHVVVIDPMLATGGSSAAALDTLRAAGATDIRVVCIVAAPEGVQHLETHHPGVRIFTPAVDQGLNDRKFIVPGLGDFGDRLFGTL